MALWSYRGGLTAPRTEVSLHVDPQALADGFREGVTWHGLYRDGEHVGFSRTGRRRTATGYSTVHTVVIPSPGGTGHQTIEVLTLLDDQFVLERFEATVSGGPISASAAGWWEPGVLNLQLLGLPGGETTTKLAMDEPPRMDQSFIPIVGRDDLAPGDRFSFTHFDPLGTAPATAIVEVVGREPLDILGERTEALHLRQQMAGQVLEIWVNELGEVLQQQLPTGLLAVRESEAEATWGVLSPAAESATP